MLTSMSSVESSEPLPIEILPKYVAVIANRSTKWSMNQVKSNGTPQEEEARENHQVKDSAGCLLSGDVAMGGQKLLSFIVGVLVCVVAAPTFLIYFIKSPSPLQDVYTFGVSYYHLVFIFLISAVCVIISLLFFFKFTPPVILSIFITALFCSLPLIMGLKNELTLQQAILNPPFFSSWPFFLRPLYILVEFLFPLGILIALYLQLKNIFSKKPHGYIFLGVTMYLAAATFIGFSGLLQAGQPNIMTALTRHSDLSPSPNDQPTALKRPSPERDTESREKIQPPGVLTQGPQSELPSQLESTPAQNEVPVEESKMALIDRKLGLLEGKIDSISKELEQVKSPLTAQARSVPAPLASLPSPELQNTQPSSEGVVTEIDQSLELLSAKVNQMIASFEKVKNPAVKQQQQAIADVRYKMELLTATLDQLLSRLNQSEYLTTQEQGSSIGKGNRVHSLTTEGQNTPSSELMEVSPKDRVSL